MFGLIKDLINTRPRQKRRFVYCNSITSLIYVPKVSKQTF